MQEAFAVQHRMAEIIGKPLIGWKSVQAADTSPAPEAQAQYA